MTMPMFALGIFCLVMCAVTAFLAVMMFLILADEAIGGFFDFLLGHGWTRWLGLLYFVTSGPGSLFFLGVTFAVGYGGYAVLERLK